MDNKPKYLATLADALEALESGNREAREELARKYPLFVTSTKEEILMAIKHISPRQLERALRGDVVFDYEIGRMVKPETKEENKKENKSKPKDKPKKIKAVKEAKEEKKKKPEEEKDEEADEFDDLLDDELDDLLDEDKE